MTSPRRPCPSCGADNRADARTCRLCGEAMQHRFADSRRGRRYALRRTDFVAAARHNIRQTRLLMAVLLGLAALLGFVLGLALEQWLNPQGGGVNWLHNPAGWRGLFIMLGITAVWIFIASLRSGPILMRISGAHKASREDQPVLHNVVEEMAIAAGLPKPAIYVIDTPALNAFAAGMRPERATLGVTRGLLEQLNRDELQGVVAHEMGHIVNWDIRYATAVSILVGMIVLVSDGMLRNLRHSGRRNAGPLIVIAVLLALLSPFVAKLVQMAISRQREFLADATSVRLTRNPHGLIGALAKLQQGQTRFDTANRATAHLFIANPLHEFSESIRGLWATHPPIERRIARLQNLGQD